MRHTKKNEAVRRRVVNLRLLTISVMALLVIAPACYAWHKHRLSKTSDVLLARAAQLEQAGKWSRATSYYRRYLLLQPEDTDTLVRLVQAYAKREPDAKRIYRLNKLLYQTLGRAPNRDDLRLMLAENLLKVGEYASAEEEAKKLVVSADSEDPNSEALNSEAIEAKKIIAFSRYSRVREKGNITIVEVLKELDEVVEELPADIQLVEITANLLRQQARNPDLDITAPAARADLLMQRMVNANSEKADALLARYRYHVRNKLPGADEDLDAALELDPKHVETLLLASWRATEDGNLDRAEKLLRRAREVDPRDGRAYLALEKLLGSGGNMDGAIEMLREGRKLARNYHLEIDIALTGRLIATQDLEDAEQILNKLDRESSVGLARMNAERKILFENQLRLLRARLAIAQRRIQPAFTLLRAILAAEGTGDAKSMSEEALQATALLAQNLTAQTRWDMARGYWDVLANARPHRGMIVLSAAKNSLYAGHPEASIAYLERYLTAAQPSLSEVLPEFYVQLVQSHLNYQLRRPIAERNWAEFLAALKQAKEQAPSRWEISVAAVNYLIAEQQPTAESQDANKDESQKVTAASALKKRTQAINLLNTLETQFPQVPDVWKQLVIANQRLDRPKEAQRALDRYRSLEKSVVKVAELQVALLSSDQKFEAAEKVLTAAIPRLEGVERLQMEILLVNVLVKVGKNEAAQSLIGKLIEANQTNPKLVIAGVELSLKFGDLQTAEKWERYLQGNQLYDFERRYLRCRRLLASYATLTGQQRQSLAALLEELRGARPRWYPVVVLAAQYSDLQENPEQALQDYQLAVSLGDRRPQTLERLVSLLSAQGRLSEAQEYLSQLTSEQPGNVQFELAEISLAVKQNHLGEAVDLATQALERNPSDPMKHIVLASMLARDGQTEAAEDLLRQATERFAEDQRVWSALFILLVEVGRLEDARIVLGSLVDATELSAGKRAFVLAQAHQKLGDLEEAKANYQLAIQKEPNQVAARLRFARMMLASDVASAREQYQAVLEIEAENDEARRALAQLLVETGREDDAAQAMALLQTGGDTSALARTLDNRLRAYLLTNIGSSRSERLRNCRKAQQILQQEVEGNQDQNRNAALVLLARVFEQEAELSRDDSILESSREQYRRLVDRANPSSYHLMFYIEFLLRHTKPDAPFASQFLNDARLRFAELKEAQSREGIETDSLTNLRVEVQLMQLADQLDKATDALNEFAKRHESKIAAGDSGKKAKGQLYAVIGSLFSSLDKHEQAEVWYRRLVDLYPEMYTALGSCLARQGRLEDAVDVCLQAYKEAPSTRPIAVVAQLLTSSERILPNQSEIESLIESTLDANRNDINLLLATAVWQVGQQDNEKAIELFRRVIELNPEHTLALNNLATLLSERPDQLEQALQYIERAMDIEGRKKPLLDTQGTIFLKMKNPEQAVACLEEATVSEASDPRYFFHLAAAYDLVERTEDARTTLQLALEYGLEDALLTEDDRQLLARLQEKMDASKGGNQ